MALVAQFTTPHGIDLAAAYIRLEDVRSRNVPFQPADPKRGQTAIMPHTIGSALAIVYAGADQRALEKPAVDSIGFTFVVNTSEGSPSLVEQAYAACAALPQFTDPAGV